MKLRQSVLLDTAHRVQTFLDENTTLIGPTLTSARQNFDDAVLQLTTMAATQTGSAIAAKGGTARQKALRATLRNNHMKPVATVAKLLLSDVPEIGALAVKATTLGTPQLVAAAQGMADAAGPYEHVFTQNGLPDDFIPKLRGAADTLTASLSGQQQSKAAVSGAVQGMRVQEGRVRKLLQLLNALVVPKLGTNATLLAKWGAARAIDNASPITAVPSSVSAPSAGTVSGGSATPPPATTPATGAATPPNPAAAATSAAAAPAPTATPQPAPAPANGTAPSSQG